MSKTHKAPELVAYRVLRGTVRAGGQDYTPLDRVQLPAEEGESLVRLGVLERVALEVRAPAGPRSIGPAADDAGDDA